MSSGATPAEWPEWMADRSIDVNAILAREVAGRPVAPGDVERELDELMPPGFELSEAIRRFAGVEAGERMAEPATVFAPRVSPPAPTPMPEPEPRQELAPEPTPPPSPIPETEQMAVVAAGDVGIDPVATILASPVAEPEGALSDLQLGAEASSPPAPTVARRGDDDLANLYDLAREEGGADGLIDPEELPDLIDELMVNEEPALPLDSPDPGQLTEYELESSAAPPQTVEVEQRAAPAAPDPSPDVDILVEPASTRDFDDFDDYDLIEEDGDESLASLGGGQRSSSFPTPAQIPGAPATTVGPFTEADSALNEIFGLSRPSDAPPESLDSRHPPFEDLPPLDQGDETVDEATVVQQGPFTWDRLGHGGGAAAPRKPEAPAASHASAPAIQPAFAPPPEPDDWFTQGAGAASQPAGSRPGDGAAPAQPQGSRPSSTDELDAQGRKRKSSFFRKLFGGGDEQK